MDFGSLPPEVNSARMYSGAGSSPLVAAASAWNRLAAELNTAAGDYESIVTRLTGEEWFGPASASMAESVAPYVDWMNATATRAEQAAARAREAATAYETALAATVHPADVDANRTEVASLLSTNVLGQNTPAIAAAEANYGEMWAADTAAMYGYAGRSASASQVTPFSVPMPTTSATGMAGQAAAVMGSSQTAQLVSSVQSALAGLASPTSASVSASSSPTSGLDSILSDLYALVGLKYTPGSPIANLLAPWTSYIAPVQSSIAIAHFSTGAVNSAVSLSKALAPAAAAAKAVGDGAKAAAAGLPGLAAPLGAALGGGAPVAAGLGSAVAAGRLSVPPAWMTTGPALGPVTSVPISSIAAASPDIGGAGNLLGGMPLAGAGAGIAGAGPKYGFQPKIMARPPSAG